MGRGVGQRHHLPQLMPSDRPLDRSLHHRRNVQFPSVCDLTAIESNRRRKMEDSDFVWRDVEGAGTEIGWMSMPNCACRPRGRRLLYRASKRDCDICSIRAKCCTTADARKIPRDLHEDARDIARRKMKTKAFAKSRDERKRVEMRFAHLKTHHGFERMRLRGLSGARDEFHLAAIVQNLKTLALRTLGPPSTRRRASFA